jgi:hypothetical protein
MPETRLVYKPGIDLELSQTANRGGWSDCNLIRWREGMPEKQMGWEHVLPATLTGLCRCLHYWSDLTGNPWLAAGTTSNLEIVQNINQVPQLVDITPVGYVPGLVSSGPKPFSLRIWSLDNFGENLIAIPSGGPIYAWVPSNVPAPATLVTANPAILTGGEITSDLAVWQAINNGGFTMTVNGAVVNAAGLNFSAVGTVADVAAIIQAALPGVTVAGSVLTDGNWQLIAQTVLIGSAATLSYATPPLTGTDISTTIGWTPGAAENLAQGSQAPAINQGGFVAMPAQILVVFGSTPLGMTTQDPMTIRWSDQSNYQVWTPSTTNQAGSFRLPRGSRINAGIQTPLGAFIWTDIDVWAMQYIGFPLVFSFVEIGSNCGAIAQNAVTVLGSVPYWMSDHGFFRMGSSGAEQIPCTVWDFVFKDLDQANQDKCVAATDYHYSEVMFFFPSKSGGTGEIDSYVKYNVAENTWDKGSGPLARTAWTDFNQPGPPLSVDLNNLIQQQDTGFDADGVAMAGSFVQSGYTDISSGGEIVLANRFIPDFLWEGETPNLNVNFLFRNFPGEAPTEVGPFNITPTTQLVGIGRLVPYPIMGIRAREMALRLDFSALGSWARFGTPRVRVQPDGKL